VKEVITGFEDPNAFLAKGIFAGGAKYMALKADNKSTYGKKVRLVVPACLT
jgi:hypothetical protein